MDKIVLLIGDISFPTDQEAIVHKVNRISLHDSVEDAENSGESIVNIAGYEYLIPQIFKGKITCK